MVHPYGALFIGTVAGILSVVGYRYITVSYCQAFQNKLCFLSHLVCSFSSVKMKKTHSIFNGKKVKLTTPDDPQFSCVCFFPRLLFEDSWTQNAKFILMALWTLKLLRTQRSWKLNVARWVWILYNQSLLFLWLLPVIYIM